VGSRGFAPGTNGDITRPATRPFFSLNMLFNFVLLGMLILDDERVSLVLEKHTDS
jgi:hypothetical protein